MKKKIILFLSFFLVVTVFTQAQTKTKRALIVAIGKYDFAKTGWKPINVDNDVLLIQEALRKQEFPKENIITLKDAAATKAGIEKALDDLAKNSGPGDVVVIHFSSHGQQLEDDGEDEMDRKDEAIVPYGAIYNPNPVEFPKYAPGYIRDDLFGDKITAIRNSLGSTGDLLVLLDACHSGTGTRGPADVVVRGGYAPMVSASFDTKKIGESDQAGVFKESDKLRLNTNAATYVVLSGAQAQELNWESRDEKGKPVGSLSYAFSKALSTLEGTTSYRSLFASIENVMREKAPKQKPVMEGDGVDRELFGGNYLKQKTYFTINETQSNKDAIEINAGTVSGVTEGSIVSFYPSGTVDPAGKQALQKGTVTAARNFTATVKLDKPDNDLFKKSPWAFVTELSYGGKKIKLKVNNQIQGAAAKAQTAFKSFPLVELDNNGDLYLDTCGAVDKWIFKYAVSGETFGDRKDSTFSIADTARMRETLRRFDRYQYLQNLKFTEEGLSAKVELVFLDNDRKNIDSAKMASRTKMTGLELKEGDQVYLKITNTGDKSFYINVMDIQPDGKINPLLPNKNLRDRNNRLAPIKAENCKVGKSDSILYRDLTITIGPPYGDETLKVFLSGEQLDLEDILTDDANDSQSRGPGGVLNNMAKIFKSSKISGSKTRGTNPTVNTSQNGTIFSVPFRIVPK